MTMKKTGQGGHRVLTYDQVADLKKWLEGNEQTFRTKTRVECAAIYSVLAGHPVSDSTISLIGNKLYPKPVKKPQQMELCGCGTCPMVARIEALEKSISGIRLVVRT